MVQPILGIASILLGVAGLSFLEGGFGFLPMARRIEFASNGAQIYYTGVSRRTGPISFRGGPMWLWMHGGGCVACHGTRGRGGVPVMLANRISPDIRYARLTGEQAEEHQEPAHPPYTGALIKRAVIDGVDPGGRPLDWTMPRWRLADDDFQDLLAHLKTLK